MASIIEGSIASDLGSVEITCFIAPGSDSNQMYEESEMTIYCEERQQDARRSRDNPPDVTEFPAEPPPAQGPTLMQTFFILPR